MQLQKIITKYYMTLKGKEDTKTLGFAKFNKVVQGTALERLLFNDILHFLLFPLQFHYFPNYLY